MAKTKLSNMDITKVDLVNKPGNQESKILLYKNEKGEVIEKNEDEELDSFEELVEKTVDKVVKKQKGSEKKMEDMTKEQKKIMELEEKIKMMEAMAKEKKVKKEETQEDVMKSLPENIKKMFEDVQKQKDEAEKEIKKMKDEESTKEYVAKASELSNLGIKADEFGLVLKNVAEASKETFESVMTVLKTANDSVDIKKFQTVGTSGTDEIVSNSYEALEKKAEIMAEEEKITKSKAIAKLLTTEEGRKAYNENRNGGK